jgi:hypothetical protein
MGNCKTCKHWTRYLDRYPSSTSEEKFAGGLCDSEKIREAMDDADYGADMLVYSYNEGGEFWTGPDFGSVNYLGGVSAWG